MSAPHERGTELVMPELQFDLRRATELQQRLAAIVESSDDAIVGKSLDGIIQSWNRGAERIFGYKAEEVMGKHISIIAPPIPGLMRQLPAAIGDQPL